MADAIPPVISLHVRNRSTVVQRSEYKVAFTALVKQANNDLHKYWKAESEDARPELYVPYVDEICEVPDGTKWPDRRDAWRMTIWDYPYQAWGDADVEDMPIEGLDSVGYHWFNGVVAHMVVFAALSEQVGLPWTHIFSHELLEALADPTATATMGADYELEICDPVQYDAYQIDGVVVANFVTPHWFEDPDANPKPTGPFDFANRLTSPGGLTPGGSRTRRTVGGEDRTAV